jgi:hypothetical protein
MSDINVTMTTAQPINVKTTIQTIQVKMTIAQPINIKVATQVPVNVKMVTAIPIVVKMTNPGGGDMLKSIYDKDGDGIVDTCHEVDGGTWE